MQRFSIHDPKVPATRFCLYTILTFTVLVPLSAGYLYSLLTHHSL
jgi:hypothetical protein